MRRPSPSLSIELPPEWEDRSILTYVGPDERGFRPSVIIARRPSLGIELLQFAGEQEKLLVKQLLRVQVHGKRELSIAGRPAVMLDFSFHSREAGKLRQLLAFVSANDEHLSVSLTTSAEVFESKRAELERVVVSLEVSA